MTKINRFLNQEYTQQKVSLQEKKKNLGKSSKSINSRMTRSQK